MAGDKLVIGTEVPLLSPRDQPEIIVRILR